MLGASFSFDLGDPTTRFEDALRPCTPLSRNTLIRGLSVPPPLSRPRSPKMFPKPPVDACLLPRLMVATDVVAEAERARTIWGLGGSRAFREVRGRFDLSLRMGCPKLVVGGDCIEGRELGERVFWTSLGAELWSILIVLAGGTSAAVDLAGDEGC